MTQNFSSLSKIFLHCTFYTNSLKSPLYFMSKLLCCLEFTGHSKCILYSALPCCVSSRCPSITWPSFLSLWLQDNFCQSILYASEDTKCREKLGYLSSNSLPAKPKFASAFDLVLKVLATLSLSSVFQPWTWGISWWG